MLIRRVGLPESPIDQVLLPDLRILPGQVCDLSCRTVAGIKAALGTGPIEYPRPSLGVWSNHVAHATAPVLTRVRQLNLKLPRPDLQGNQAVPLVGLIGCRLRLRDMENPRCGLD
jgi:hypothetical protein